MKKLLLLLPIILLVSCNPCKKLAKKCPPQTKDSIVYVETIKEDPNFLIPDSLYWKLEFECDSNYEVILRAFDELNTGFETEVTIKEVIRWKEDETAVKRLEINLSAFTDSIKILNRTIEKVRSEQKWDYIKVEVPKKYVPKFYKYCFVFSLLVVLGCAAYVYMRIKGIKLK